MQPSHIIALCARVGTCVYVCVSVCACVHVCMHACVSVYTLKDGWEENDWEFAAMATSPAVSNSNGLFLQREREG